MRAPPDGTAVGGRPARALKTWRKGPGAGHPQRAGQALAIATKNGRNPGIHGCIGQKASL